MPGWGREATVTNQAKPFLPDWICHPCESIAEGMDDQGLTLGEFAGRMGMSVGDAEDLVEGRVGISLEIAARLAEVLGSTAEFWTRLQANYEGERVRLGL
jgi:addiction module HigA family antidote